MTSPCLLNLQRLSHQHALPKVCGPSHLGHDFEKDDCAAKSIDEVHDAYDFALDVSDGQECLCADGVKGRSQAQIVGHGIPANALMSDDTHGDEADKQILPHSAVGDGGKGSQRLELRHDDSNEGPDERAEGEADAVPSCSHELDQRLTAERGKGDMSGLFT